RQGVQGVGMVAGADRRIDPEAKRVVLIHPRVIRALGGALTTSERRAGNWIERPPLGTAFARVRAWPVERPLAPAAVQACEVTARQRPPRHAFAVDVEAAHAEAGWRHLVDLGQRRLRGIRAQLNANHPAGMTDVRAPDGAVGRAERDPVEPEPESLVLGRI